MAIGDITILKNALTSGAGSLTFNVAANTTAINAGEPVTCPLGAVQAAIPAATNGPVVGTTYMAGIAETAGTQTASVAGVVNVNPINPATVYLIAPKVTATFTPQSAYDALVGSRVLLDLTTGTYTILAADSANNGCVIQPLDISKYPGKVAFCFRSGANYLA